MNGLSSIKHYSNRGVGNIYLHQRLTHLHLVEKNLLEALDSGQISGGCLDVFSREPLPENHPFWSHPQIIITPHVATYTDSEYWTKPIVDAIRCLRAGVPLKNVVDCQQGCS